MHTCYAVFFVKFFLREQMEKFKSVVELVKQLKPTEPVYCIRRKSIKISSKYFKDKFPGKILYAVKTNPNPIVLKTIIESGINHFDIASIKEIEAIKKIDPKANCSYMHTVKSRENINEAYFKHGIKVFSLDTMHDLLMACLPTRRLDGIGKAIQKLQSVVQYNLK